MSHQPSSRIGRTELSLVGLLRDRFDSYSSQPALVAGDAVLDYSTLAHRVESTASQLRAAGVQKDDIVAFAASRDTETLTLMLATCFVGGACLPLDVAYPEARLDTMLGDARPRVLVAPRGMRGAWLHHSGVQYVERERLSARTGGNHLERVEDREGSFAYVLFTSGSSGRPKGVLMRSRVLRHLVAWHVAHPRLGQPARTLQFAPLSFDVCFQEIHSTLATGGTLVVPDESMRRDPFALLELLARERVERLFLPYVALQSLAEAVAAGGDLPVHLRDVVSAGERLRVTPAMRALFKAVPGCVLHNHYGPTETHVVTSHELHGDPDNWPDLPAIGRPLPHVRVRVADEQLRDVATGMEGELLLGGECLAAGYIGQPQRTAERFVETDGADWYRSGDLVRDAGDGVFEYLGRLDSQIKIDGYRIEPGEIENVLCQHDGVAEAVVVAEGQGDGRRLHAYVVPRDPDVNDDALREQLRAHCEESLPTYLVPGAFELRPALPLTASGKIDRRSLEQEDTDPSWEWPASATLQEQLGSLWRHLLDLEELDPQANLFDLGARSLTVVRALTALRGHGYRSLSAAQIYEHPSVARQAALLEGGSTPATQADARARGDRQRDALARFRPRPGGST